MTASDREWLLQAHHTASRDYDKALMTLAGGGLGVSIMFIRDVVPYPHTKWLLAAGWILLALSLLAILTGFLTSQKHLVREIGDLDNPPAEPRSDRYGRLTAFLTWASCVCFVLGVVCVAIFVVYNL